MSPDQLQDASNTYAHYFIQALLVDDKMVIRRSECRVLDVVRVLKGSVFDAPWLWKGLTQAVVSQRPFLTPSPVNLSGKLACSFSRVVTWRWPSLP